MSDTGYRGRPQGRCAQAPHERSWCRYHARVLQKPPPSAMASIGRLALIALRGAAIALPAMASASAVSTTAQRTSDAMNESRFALDRGEYLRAIAILRGAAFGPDGTIDDDVLQALEQTLPMVTGELPATGLRPPPEPPGASDAATLDALRSAVPRDAIAEIVKRARATSVVILNEAHSCPQHRAFALAVARALRPLGYRILAAEAFANSADDGPETPIGRLQRDGIVRRSTGYYTRDPVFAGFVRQAIALGYKPESYEMRGDQFRANAIGDDAIAVREDAQAQNLYAKVFSGHPGVKVLVYVGHGHVAERLPDDVHGQVLAMAGRLKNLTGVDPLTIDQTQLNDTGGLGPAAYAVASARITRPSIPFRGRLPLVVGRFTGEVDLEVVHPRRTYEHGRPGWLARVGGRALPIPRALLPAHGQRLIQAFATDAPSDAVPLDQVLVSAGKIAPPLLVREAQVRFRTQDVGVNGASPITTDPGAPSRHRPTVVVS